MANWQTEKVRFNFNFIILVSNEKNVGSEENKDLMTEISL